MSSWYKKGMVLVVMLLCPLAVLANGTFPPVIGHIPDSIIIGNSEDNVGPDIGFFQFPNAINLDNYVCDID
ncbi:MAG: hypothetical protein NT106_04710, partial [Candidatus Sumerlaeota bacterium]|nr:hypothetical protein [Candidatus Sumerlaeota bacterium]